MELRLPTKAEITEGLVDAVLIIGIANTAYNTYGGLIPLTYAAGIVTVLGVATQAVPLLDSIINWFNTQSDAAVAQAKANIAYIEQLQKKVIPSKDETISALCLDFYEL